jgi:predicted Ser/Thr protein kinase
MARLDAAAQNALLEWVEARIAAGAAFYARGYQGETHLYETPERRYIIKVAPGTGVAGWAARWMLHREYEAYRRLEGFVGAPACYGLLQNRFLVLDYVNGTPLRRAAIVDRDTFFTTLLAHIEEMHRRGVAHADLKRKDNLIVVDGRLPCLIDFGAAVIKRSGFAPVNHYLFELARRFDLNAWAKLKYRGQYDEMTPADRAHFRRTWIEKIARRIKHHYLSIKHRLAR